MKKSKNIDQHSVEGSGYEWERFDQESLSKQQQINIMYNN